ncbi:hypothetical protein A6R68_04203, partial [Neotoma lepida]
MELLAAGERRRPGTKPAMLPPAVRNSLKWMMNISFVLSMRRAWATEVAADALGEKWKGSVVWITKKVFPQSKVFGLVLNTPVPQQLGPERTRRIWKIFNLSKEDDIHQYVVRKPLNKEGSAPHKLCASSTLLGKYVRTKESDTRKLKTPL